MRKDMPMPGKKLLPILLPALVLAMSQSVCAADAAAGRKLAEQWCAKCHDINMGAPFKLNPPSFASIAAYRPSDVILGKIITPSAHSGMPDTLWTLQREDFDNLVAYITSLAAN
jgi:mono/diheme cytochrome c family protein